MSEYTYVSPLRGEDPSSFFENGLNTPVLRIQSFQTPNILFIIDDPSNLDPSLDKPFVDYLNRTLNYNVTLHEDNNSYSLTSVDAIIISDSIDGSVNSLADVTVPVLTMEANNWNVFQLGTGDGISDKNDIVDVINASHYITNNFSVGPLTVYNDTNADVGYLKGPFPQAIPSGSNIQGLIAPSTKGGEKFSRSLITLEKGENNWALESSAERRVFLGTSYGTNLTSQGWKLWNTTVNWILNDDIGGNASIRVNVKDLNNNNIQNANVTLSNITDVLVQKTNVGGYTDYHNITWGKYNITVDFYHNNKTESANLTNEEIFPNRTYNRTSDFTFDFQLPINLDNIPPVISNVYFEKNSKTFFADITDDSPFLVNLSLTATNLTNLTVVIQQNFTMVDTQSGNTYFNDTALDTLGGEEINISVSYNIIAKDIGGNVNKIELRTFLLSDPDPPIIHAFNVTDNGDGTLDFFANISDSSGIQDPVLLSVNGSLKSMYLNGSGYWVYRMQEFYGIFLNYTIYSVNDSVGNENGSKLYPAIIQVYDFTVSDTSPPQIWYPTPIHSEGYTEWNIEVNESTIYQSGLKISSVNITISVNGGANSSANTMDDLGGGYFYYFDTYNFNDVVEYWINASDIAGNYLVAHPGPYIIVDNSFPVVTFTGQEFGNGTIEFRATARDWPYNITTVLVYENSTGPWLSYILNKQDEIQYSILVQDFEYNAREIVYYVTAEDTANNLYIPTPDQYKKLILTDIVSPDVQFIIENSTINDGETTIRAWAEDLYGSSQYVTDTFYLNITHQSVTTTYIMVQEVFFHISTHNFVFGDEVTFTVWTEDDAGNQGLTSRSITVGDFSAPKIKSLGHNENQNGTVTIWAEIKEGSNGSGLPSANSSIVLEYIFTSFNQETMAWNGSGDYYSFSISGFEPGNTFAFRITAFDNSNNLNITDWDTVSIVDETPPVSNGYGYLEELLDPFTTQLSFWVDAEDKFGSIEGAYISINYLVGSSFQNKTAKMQYNGSYFIYAIQMDYNVSFNYSIQIFDEANNYIEVGNVSLRTYWGPVIYQAGIIRFNDSTIIVWANVSDWGSGVAEVLLEYSFGTENGVAGHGAGVPVEMEFNGSLYLANLTFSEDEVLQWRVIAKDENNNSFTRIGNNYSIILKDSLDLLDLNDLLPILGLVAIIPLLFVLSFIVLQRSYQRRINLKKQREKEIVTRFSDILNLRAIICRNNHGLAFYTEEFLLKTQDLDLTAGLTSAVSSLVTEVSQKEIRKGEFDLLEREGFGILSHNGEYSTITMVSEGKLSTSMRKQIENLHDEIEKHFSQEELESPLIEPLQIEIKSFLEKHLKVGLLRPLFLDQQFLKEKQDQFNKTEQKWFDIIQQIPSLMGPGKLAFYMMTFTSFIETKGVLLIKAYSFLEKCYDLGIVKPFS